MHKRTILRSILLASTILLATACTAAAPDATTTAAASPASAIAAPASDAASVTAASTAAPADAAQAASAVADSAASAAASTAASAATAAAIAPPKGMPAGPAPVEGTDYTLIDTPDQPTGDKVQVTEVFGYGCPHCNALQPSISVWEKKLPSDVQFNYLPAAFGPGAPHCWDEFARAFFAAQAMGVPTSKSHDGIYKAVWDQHRFTGEECTVIPSLFADYGLDPKIFASTMQSFAVSAKIGAARDQAMRWGVDSTPTVVVDGKYRVNETVTGGPTQLLHTIDWLIAKQRPEHAKH